MSRIPWWALLIPGTLLLPCARGHGAEVAALEPTASSFARVLTLVDARARALALSPELRAARGAALAAAGDSRQARAWPNPEIEVAAEDVGGDLPGWDEAEISGSIAQRLELFGTRGARARAGSMQREAAEQGLAAVQLDLLAEVDRRFAGALAAQARVGVSEENGRIADDLVRAVTALVKGGEVSPIEADRAQAERARVELELQRARLDEGQARRVLAGLWGGCDPDFERVEGSLEVSPVLPGRDALLAETIDLPDLRGRAAEAQRAEAELRHASRARWPEVTVRGGIKNVGPSDEWSYLGGLSLGLPLLDRNGGAVEAAHGRLQQARAEEAAEQCRIALARASAADVLAAAIATAESLRDVTLPRTQAIFEAVQEGYRRGRFAFLDLIDARRTMAETRLEYIDALEAVWVARADLERLLSRPLPTTEGESR
jgi:outer membrane protein, heavy metal efflux system